MPELRWQSNRSWLRDTTTPKAAFGSEVAITSRADVESAIILISDDHTRFTADLTNGRQWQGEFGSDSPEKDSTAAGAVNSSS